MIDACDWSVEDNLVLRLVDTKMIGHLNRVPVKLWWPADDEDCDDEDLR